MGSLLKIGVFGLAAAAATSSMACPDFRLMGRESYNATGAQLRNGAQFDVVAGGDNAVINCLPSKVFVSDTGDGYFTDAPDFSFDLSGVSGMRMAIGVVSQCDSALLVSTATGDWVYDDDDNGNLDARITLSRPQNGILDIWVGTFDGEYCDAVMTLQTY